MSRVDKCSTEDKEVLNDGVLTLSGVNQCRTQAGIRMGDCLRMFVEWTACWNLLLGMNLEHHSERNVTKASAFSPPSAHWTWELYGHINLVSILIGTSFFLGLRGQPGGAGKHHQDERSHLAVVACGPRLEETLTMLKSALLLSRKPLHFYIFAEEDLHDSFRNTVSVLLCNTTTFLCVFVFLSSSLTLLLYI